MQENKTDYSYININELKPYENNARLHPEEQINKIVNSIKEFGFITPVIIDENNTILVGHGRTQAAKAAGLTKVPYRRITNLTDEQKRAYILADNKLSDIAEWDEELLKIELENISLDMTAFGFDDFTIDIDEDAEAEVVEDEIPEAPEEPRAHLGDLYKLGKHRLLCGDSTDALNIDILMNGKKADMVFTDPPYGMKLDTDYSKMSGNGRKGKTYTKVIGDNEDFNNNLITTIFNNFNYCDEIFLWGVDYYFDIIPEFKKGNLIVLDKTLQSNGDAGYNSEFELLWTKNQHKKEVIHFNWFRYFGLSQQDIKTREHPTQKPLQVITPFIEKYSKEKNIIVDLYGGSGSTLIACEQLNRACYVMELEPKYVDVIIKRWETLTGQKAELIKGGE